MCKSPALFNSPLNFICSHKFLLLQTCWNKVGLGCLVPTQVWGEPFSCCWAMQQPDPVPEEHEALGTCWVHLGVLAGKVQFGFKLPVPA